MPGMAESEVQLVWREVFVRVVDVYQGNLDEGQTLVIEDMATIAVDDSGEPIRPRNNCYALEVGSDVIVPLGESDGEFWPLTSDSYLILHDGFVLPSGRRSGPEVVFEGVPEEAVSAMFHAMEDLPAAPHEPHTHGADEGEASVGEMEEGALPPEPQPTEAEGARDPGLPGATED